MQQKTGYTYNLKVISDKHSRKTLKYEEFRVIADILGYNNRTCKKEPLNFVCIDFSTQLTASCINISASFKPYGYFFTGMFH